MHFVCKTLQETGTFLAFREYQDHGLNWRMNLKGELNDFELLRSMLAGDEEALSVLYRRRQGSVYRFALQMSGSQRLQKMSRRKFFFS